MSTLTVELPDTPELREGDEVTIRARMKGHRLVAETVRREHAPQPVETDAQATVRSAALAELRRLCDETPPTVDAGDESFDAFVREWSGAAKHQWSDEELDRARYEHIKAKHLK